MNMRNFMFWILAGFLMAWIGAVAFETRRCRGSGGQFSILGWRCVMMKPSIMLRRDLERT